MPCTRSKSASVAVAGDAHTHDVLKTLSDLFSIAVCVCVCVYACVIVCVCVCVCVFALSHSLVCHDSSMYTFAHALTRSTCVLKILSNLCYVVCLQKRLTRVLLCVAVCCSVLQYVAVLKILSDLFSIAALQERVTKREGNQ